MKLRRPAIVGVLLAVLLTVLAAVGPPAAAPSRRSSPPSTPRWRSLPTTSGSRTKARYVVVPQNGVVRVTVDVAVVNQKPNRVSGGVITRYFYDSVNLGVQLEATHLRATQDGAPVRVTSAVRRGFRLVTISFRNDIYFGETAHVRLQFDLPAGAPRSDSDVRVGPAFATFLAWAFGDRGSVRIDVPKAFDVDISGEDMEASTTAISKVFTATTDDALGWFAWVNARNDDGLTRERLDLADGEQVVVRGWPEDSRWRRRVSVILSDSVPDLVGRIGLPWPVDGPLNVLEVHTPLLEGYAGFYDPKSDEITISENLDDLTIVHEASHAWFNSRLFTDRWINEGLAEEYASQVLAAETRGKVDPAPVKRSAKVAFPLAHWDPPAPIRDAQSDAREQYGYDAAWTVIRDIADEAGEDGMQQVFRAASDGTTAYPGDGAPEHTALPNDWRRFLDLTQELGGVDDAASLIKTWVLPNGAAAQLADRETARAAYEQLATADGDWAAPPVVRLALDGWRFGDAEARIQEATDVVRQRDETASQATAAGLSEPDGLETAYESADTAAELADASALAANTQASLSAVIAAGAAAAAPRDWVTTLGLSGKDPDADLAAARSAWEAGNLTEANDRAALVAGTLSIAAEAGRGRAIVIGGGATLVLLLLLVLLIVAIVRWRGRSRRAPVAAIPCPVTPSGAPPDAPGLRRARLVRPAVLVRSSQPVRHVDLARPTAAPRAPVRSGRPSDLTEAPARGGPFVPGRVRENRGRIGRCTRNCRHPTTGPGRPRSRSRPTTCSSAVRRSSRIATTPRRPWCSSVRRASSPARRPSSRPSVARTSTPPRPSARGRRSRRCSRSTRRRTTRTSRSARA